MASAQIISSLFLITAFQIWFIDAFHPNYSYIEATHGFYNIQSEKANWTVARDTCQSEGGILFHPQSDAELGMVLSELVVGDNFVNEWIHTGLSDLGELKNYITVDGLPVSQVFNKWFTGQPDTANDNRRCVALNVYTHDLYVSTCDYGRQYICKILRILPTEPVVTATQVDSSIKDTMLLERLAESAAKQAAALERLTAIQETVLQTLTDTMKSQIANQTAALERIAEAGANEAAAIERIAVAGANEASAIERIAVADAKEAAAIERMSLSEMNQTAFMERQALALEKLIDLQGVNNQINEQ